MKKVSISLTLVFLMSLFGLQTVIAKERVYNIGKSGGFPPFDLDDPLEGVNIDILNAICEANSPMQCKIKIVESTDCLDSDSNGQPFVGEILASGQVDGCMGWFITPAREQLGMEFTEPYSGGTTPQLIVSDDNTDFDALGAMGQINDATIGFISGFFNDISCLNLRYDGNFGTEFYAPEAQGRSAMLMALANDVIDLVFWDSIDTLPEGTKVVGEAFEDCGPRLSFATFPSSQKRKNKSDPLRRDFNCGLALIRQNGTLQEICDYWTNEENVHPACFIEGPLPTEQCLADNPNALPF